MKYNLTIIIAVLFALYSKVGAQAPGTLDLSFGTNGKVVYDRDQTDLYNDVQVQPDGKIVAVGTSMTPTYTAAIEVSRFLADGSFDSSFGTSGHFNYSYNANPETMAYRCLIKSNGKILIAGHSTNYTTWGILLIQLNANGTPDATFGTNGVVYQSLSQGENAAFGLTLQGDNKILVSGYKQDVNFNYVPVVVRFSSAGVLDASFGSGGVAEVAITAGDNDFSTVCVQADGKILAAGHYNSGMSWFTLLIARFNANGSLDPTYGNAGIVNMNLGNVDDEFFDMQLSGSDCILTGFTVTQTDMAYHLLLMKFDQNGQLITAFGNGGKVIWGTAPYTFGDALRIQDDGKIIVAGCTGGLQPANNDWALWRFNADGSLDNSFGNNGVTTTDFFSNTEEALGIALWENMIIVAGKTRNTTDYLDFAVAKYWNSIAALFTASTTTLCNGNSVQYTDQSMGSPTAWNWTFEGGTPATSTLQNPFVTYSTPGIFDVTLVITKGTETNTFFNPDFIHVDAPVASAPSIPSGSAEICGSFNYQYTTLSVPGATSYIWSVDPVTAGTISGTGLTGTLAASNFWSGPFTVKVAGSNTCGAGPVSPVLNCTLYHQPNVLSLYSGGGYCAGQPGYEIKLVDSELGVDYQLYKDGLASGAPVPGTGEELSFGYQTSGSYTISGTNAFCSAYMQGTSINYLIDPPATAAQPTGPSTSCNNVPSTFTATLPANGFSLVWTLTPSNSGTITQPTLTSAVVMWNQGFSGSAEVTVQGINECDTGTASPARNIMINPVPSPAVSGITSVCKGQEISYSINSTSGSTFIWSVSGGTITSGQSSSEITVLWGYPGTGNVSVSETSGAGCTGSSLVLSVAISECTGSTENLPEGRIVYPNPATNSVFIQNCRDTQIRIFSLEGKLLLQKEILDDSIELDISGYSKGMYSIVIQGKSVAVFEKLIIK